VVDRQAVIERQAAGRIKGTEIRYGYAIRRMIALYERGLGFTRIARQLNSEGLRTPKGKPFTGQLVAGLIQRRK